MCDDNGILLGVNKYNSSLIIVDMFNSAIYKNANMAILGTDVYKRQPLLFESRILHLDWRSEN